VKRRAGNELTASTEMQSTIGQAFRADDNSFGYRTTITLDDEAIYLEVIISAEYELKKRQRSTRCDEFASGVRSVHSDACCVAVYAATGL